MTDCRNYSKNKNYMNHNSQNGLLFLIICSMVLIFETHGITLKTESNNTSCSDAYSCIKCTIKNQCAWSLQQQTCVHYYTHFILSNLTIYRKEKCPRFSVVTKYTYSNTLNNLQYIVDVSNDNVGFMNFLKESIFFCNSTTIDVYKKRINNNTIECSATISTNYLKLNSMRSLTEFIYIKFNGVLLRLDNVADHYVTFYERECPKDKKDEYCETCTWNGDSSSHYVRLCSSRNSCEGYNELYMKHNDIGRYWHFTTQKVKDECSEINVTAVDPLFGTMAVSTTITITIKNHLIFVEDRNLTVTVAGMLCANPRTSGPETITCLMSPPSDYTNITPSGPVLVKYTSDKMRELNVESSQIFQFCFNPELDADQLLEGIVSGGTSVPVRGSRFLEPCAVSSARLYVDLPDGIRSYAEGYCDPPVNETYMVCRSPRVQGAGLDGKVPVVGWLLNFGLDITSLQIVVRGPSLSFYVHPDPVLLYFEIDVNGIVVVNGLYLQYVPQEDILVRSVDSSSKVCDVVSVTLHKFECKPIMSVTASQKISVKLGNSLVFTVNRRTSPDDPYRLLDWLLPIILTVLVLVYAVIVYLRIKHQNYEMVNICKT